MWLPILGLVIGLILGSFPNIELPASCRDYTSILAVSLLYIPAELIHHHRGAKTNIKGDLYICAAALLITVLGNILGVELRLAAQTALILHLFDTLSKTKKESA